RLLARRGLAFTGFHGFEAAFLVGLLFELLRGAGVDDGVVLHLQLGPTDGRPVGADAEDAAAGNHGVQVAVVAVAHPFIDLAEVLAVGRAHGHAAQLVGLRHGHLLELRLALLAGLSGLLSQLALLLAELALALLAGLRALLLAELTLRVLLVLRRRSRLVVVLRDGADAARVVAGARLRVFA